MLTRGPSQKTVQDLGGDNAQSVVPQGEVAPDMKSCVQGSDESQAVKFNAVDPSDPVICPGQIQWDRDRNYAARPQLHR